MRLVDKVLWRGARQAFLPILPDYYALFWRQSHFDRTILAPRIEEETFGGTRMDRARRII